MKVKIHPDFRNDFDVKVNPDDYRITAFDIETGKVLKKAKKAIFINCESKIVYKEDYLPNEMKYKRVWCECENDLIIHNDEDYDYGQLTKTIIVNKKAIDNNYDINGRYHGKFPVCTVIENDKKTDCMEVNIMGPSLCIYSPYKLHPSGKFVWIETNADLELIGVK